MNFNSFIYSWNPAVLVPRKRQEMKIPLLVSSPLFVLFAKKKGKKNPKRFILIQIRNGGAEESSVTAECKHDGVETSGCASVAFINGATPFLACWLWWRGVCEGDRWCCVCRPILHECKNAAAVMWAWQKKKKWQLLALMYRWVGIRGEHGMNKLGGYHKVYGDISSTDCGRLISSILVIVIRLRPPLLTSSVFVLGFICAVNMFVCFKPDDTHYYCWFWTVKVQNHLL